jgi:hypothetical protein
VPHKPLTRPLSDRIGHLNRHRRTTDSNPKLENREQKPRLKNDDFEGAIAERTLTCSR